MRSFPFFRSHRRLRTSWAPSSSWSISRTGKCDLRDALQPVRSDYDYLVIDCPPSLGLITLNVLTAADGVIIPIQCEYYALEGISQLLNTIRLVQQNFNPALAIDGVLLTMYDSRLNLCRQVAKDAKEYFGAKVFRTVIPRNVRLAEAPSYRQADPHVRRAVGRREELSLGGAGAPAPGGTGSQSGSRRRRRRGARIVSETKRLGRGLEALLGPMTRDDGPAQGGAREIPVSAIDPNPYQPRHEFDPAALQELADSIAASGLLQPIAVRPGSEGRFELIAGERRWRAVQRLGWKNIPAVVREVDDRALLTLALIENLQRDDLSPLDAARGYQRLIEEFAIAQQEVARLVGKNRSTVSNTLRLLQLAPDILELLEGRRITEGHARALLGLADLEERLRLARECAEQDWSVRQLEARVRGEVPASGVAPTRKLLRKTKPDGRSTSAEIRRIEDAFRKRLQTDVRVTARRRGRGAITIHYYSNDDLVRVLELVLAEPYRG